MPYYLGQYAGAGTSKSPCAPAGFVPVDGFDIIDLRDDQSSLTGPLILFSPTTQADAKLFFLADQLNDPLDVGKKTKLLSILGLSTLAATTLRELIVELLANPPQGRWRPLKNEVTIGGNRVALG